MKEVRVLHIGEGHWLVQEAGNSMAPVYRFDSAAPYRPLGLAAGRSYVAFGDLLEVDEADLKAY